MLNEKEQSALRVIQDSPQWKVVLRLKDEMIDKIRGNPRIGANEWETLRTVLEQEGKIKGIEQFFQEILNQSNPDENKG